MAVRLILMEGVDYKIERERRAKTCKLCEFFDHAEDDCTIGVGCKRCGNKDHKTK